MLCIRCKQLKVAHALLFRHSLSLPSNLETTAIQEVLVRAHSIIIECKEFMHQFEDGRWIARALKKDKHRETFNELHESLTYVFQVKWESECFCHLGCSIKV